MAKPFTKLPASVVSQPKPFKIDIPQSSLDDLKTLIRLGKVGPTTYESQQQGNKYGVSPNWVRELKEQWEKDFDWRKHEAYYNTFPHYTTDIVDDDGKKYNIHFVALFSEKRNAIPLVFLHGWPGSFIEFLPILSRLSSTYTPSTLPYHIIVPSNPGFTFSCGPPLDKDFRLADLARLFDRLLISLGFGNGYVVQGGDIGSEVARIMAAEYPSCKGIHLNLGHFPKPEGADSETLSDAELEGLANLARFMSTGTAYALMQGTRPSSIGLALSTNPLALLIWIGEKFLEWTDENPSADTILASITLYWLTDTYPRSIYAYRELFTPGGRDAPALTAFIAKPVGFSCFPKEIAVAPRSWIAAAANLVFFRRHTKGGHFAALEQPDLLLKDVEDFVAQIWPTVQE